MDFAFKNAAIAVLNFESQQFGRAGQQLYLLNLI
jgi:hypothetical protein